MIRIAALAAAALLAAPAVAGLESRASSGVLKTAAAMKFTPVTAAAKLGAIKAAGLGTVKVMDAPLAVSIINPVTPSAWLSFLSPDAVYPKDNLAVLFSGDAFVEVEWKYQAGAIYLLDCTIQPNKTGSKTVDVEVDSAKQTLPVTDGHILLPVAGKPAGQEARHIFIMGTKGVQIFFRGCEITKVK